MAFEEDLSTRRHGKRKYDSKMDDGQGINDRHQRMARKSWTLAGLIAHRTRLDCGFPNLSRKRKSELF